MRVACNFFSQEWGDGRLSQSLFLPEAVQKTSFLAVRRTDLKKEKSVSLFKQILAFLHNMGFGFVCMALSIAQYFVISLHSAAGRVHYGSLCCCGLQIQMPVNLTAKFAREICLLLFVLIMYRGGTPPRKRMAKALEVRNRKLPFCQMCGKFMKSPPPPTFGKVCTIPHSSRPHFPFRQIRHLVYHV